MQEVKLYYDAFEAKNDMQKYIQKGYRIHTCTMGCGGSGLSARDRILVVYEKETERG